MKSLPFLALMLGLAGFAGFSTPAAAQTDAARLSVLTGQIEGFLEAQKAMAVKNGCILTLSGTMKTDDNPAYHAITLPNLIYTDSEKIRTDLGMFALNAAARNDDQWNISLAVPQPILTYRQTGELFIRTDIGSQNITGQWHERLGRFVKLNGTLGHVRVKDFTEGNTLSIESATIDAAMEERDTDVFTGKATAVLKNISILETDTGVTALLPLVTLESNLAERAQSTKLTKDDMARRVQSGNHDVYNLIALLVGSPERVFVTVEGLDAVNSQIQQAMLTAPANKRADFLKAVLAVSALSGLGQPVTGQTDTRSYDIAYEQTGRLTINGTDINTLLALKHH